MKFTLNQSVILLPCVFSAAVYALPPEPEVGQRWAVNYAFSDEFNGETLDQRKWRDHHRSWKGRPPAKFDPSTVSLNKGFLQIKNKKLEKADGKYSIAGGAVQSIEPTAYHGYYEAKFKASRINMSTTFWLSTHKSQPLEGKNHLGQTCENDRWSQELDIAEAVGGEIDKAFGRYFRTQMQYNTHVWYRGCQKERIGFSKGANVAEGDGSTPANNKLPNGSEVWQGVNTYAAWWKNENEVDFYLNDNFSGRVQVDTQLLEKPYRQPMQMQMLTETYNWATPYPTDAELANDQINTSYYDWVRSYFYLPVDKQAEQALSRDPEQDIFTESVKIKHAQIVLNRLNLSFLYQSDEDIKVQVRVKDKGSEKTLLEKVEPLLAGYGHKKLTLELATASQWVGSTIELELIHNQHVIAKDKLKKLK